MKQLQTIIQNFSNKYPEFTISFGHDVKTQIDVHITSEFIQFSYDVGANAWDKERVDNFDSYDEKRFENSARIETGRHCVFLDFEYTENPNGYFVIFFDKKTNEFVIENPENIPTNSIYRIIQDYSVIAEGFGQILEDYEKRGMDFVEKTYPWISPYYLDRNSGEIHVSHAGGFSMYHFNFYSDGSGRWEFDSCLEKDTVRQLKRVLKYKN